MAEYAKKTVAELTEILKSRGLPSSGKKAELVARLNEDDKTAASAPADQDVPPAETQAAAVPAAQPEPVATTQPSEPTTTEVPTTTTDTADATADDAQPETATYTLNLKASDVDSELAKRKARAERFGTSTTATETTDPSSTQATDAEAEALRNLERAKRFGTETNAISKLDEALPSERIRNNKRKAEDAPQASALDDPGLKKGFANKISGGAGRGGRFRHRGGRPDGGNNPRGPQGVTKSGRPPAFTSEKDKLAAEARKKKFATA